MNFITKLKFKKLIYPVIFGVFIVIAAAVFVWTAGFLSKAINKSLFRNEQMVESLSIKLDLENFKPAAEKLGIEISDANIQMNVNDTNNANAGIATTTAASILDKTAVKIAVYNSVKTKGLAAELKTFLETDGFKVEKTGNVSPGLETTAVKIKESKKDYGSLVKESIAKKYQLAGDEILDESEEYDIIVIIGRK